MHRCRRTPGSGDPVDVDVYISPDYRDPWHPKVRTISMGPVDYNQRVRYTIAKHVDPAGRIRLPKASRSAG